MWHLAFRNLFQSRIRVAISVGGVALALLLILALDAIFVGQEQQVTAYMNYSGADVFVSQSGVRTMHMASSSLPAAAIEAVASVPGVRSVTPVLYVTNMVVIGESRYLAYVIGLPADAKTGRPWDIAQGATVPGLGETILDRDVAQASAVGIGDTVKILGREFTIAGLSAGTANIVNSIAFIALDDFMALRGSRETVSYLLLETAPGEPPESVAARVEWQVPGVTAQSRLAFADEERRIIRDMGTDVIAIMNAIGFLIGLAVMALTVYTATLSRRAEYGVLKALGARNVDLYRTVLAQALYSVGLGLAAGLGITLALSTVIPMFSATLPLIVGLESIVKVGVASIIIAAFASVLPIRQIAALDPATVFRRKVR